MPRILSKIINGKEKGRPQRKLPKKWWLIVGAVVAHCWSSGGSLIATPDYKPAVLGSNPVISPAYSRLPILGQAAIWDSTPL
jgi:hypothetical protein